MTTEGDKELLTELCTGLETDGYAIIDGAFPGVFLTHLQQQIKDLSADEFKDAGIGRAKDFQTNSDIRSDQIMWLDEKLAENQCYIQWAEGLRKVLNHKFFLGLKEYECMFAHYPAGAFYHKHVDAFKSGRNHSTSNRKISTVLYLNPDWQSADGGELLLYHHDQEQPFKRILPELGRLVIFVSEDFPHEVLLAKRSRYSLTGWFRTQS